MTSQRMAGQVMLLLQINSQAMNSGSKPSFVSSSMAIASNSDHFGLTSLSTYAKPFRNYLEAIACPQTCFDVSRIEASGQRQVRDRQFGVSVIFFQLRICHRSSFLMRYLTGHFFHKSQLDGLK